ADEKWVEIDLGDKHRLTAAVVYTGSSYGVYTGPDRIKNFALQYWMNGSWINIPGAAEKNCKYVQVFIPFEEPVSTSKIRFVATDAGSVKLREIKVFGEDFTYDNSYDVAGIQRTGDVVLLFANGF